MARTRSFDENEVLGGAMQAFRRHGYEGVSVRQLEQATGLTSGSIYNAYGDKDGLFRAALAHYVDGFVAGRLAAHAGPGATLDDLEELFLSLFREPLTDGFGCLVTNSAIEFGGAGAGTPDEVGKALNMVETSIRSVLLREIGPGAAEPAMNRLALLYQGLLVFARAGRIGAAHRDAVRSEFDRLREARKRFRAGDAVQINPAKKE